MNSETTFVIHTSINPRTVVTLQKSSKTSGLKSGLFLNIKQNTHQLLFSSELEKYQEEILVINYSNSALETFVIIVLYK